MNRERTTYPPGHVIHMSLDRNDKGQTISVARCDCGFVSRLPWGGTARAVKQDKVIEKHWREVETANRTLRR